MRETRVRREGRSEGGTTSAKLAVLAPRVLVAGQASGTESTCTGYLERLRGECDRLKARANDYSLDAAERQTVLRALQDHGWNQKRTAVAMKIPYRTLKAKIRRYRNEGHEEFERRRGRG